MTVQSSESGVSLELSPDARQILDGVGLGEAAQTHVQVQAVDVRSADDGGSSIKHLLEIREQQIAEGRLFNLGLRMAQLGLNPDPGDNADTLANKIRLHYARELGLPDDTHGSVIFFERHRRDLINSLGANPRSRHSQKRLAMFTAEQLFTRIDHLTNKKGSRLRRIWLSFF